MYAYSFPTTATSCDGRCVVRVLLNPHTSVISITDSSCAVIMRELGEIEGVMNSFIAASSAATTIQDQRIKDPENTTKAHGKHIDIHTGGMTLLRFIIVVGVPVVLEFPL